MKHFAVRLAFALVLLASVSTIASAQGAPVAGECKDTPLNSGYGGPIHHDIYITLKDKSEKAIQKQLRLGYKYLNVQEHFGEVSFFATVLAHNLERHKQVSYLHNETNFDVAFHLVFANRCAHDKYQVSDAHVNHFIPDSKLNWKELRVFDTVEAANSSAPLSPSSGTAAR